MRKTIRTIVNVATDTGVVFSGGNTPLQAEMAGSAGLVINGVATCFAALLRLRAELQKEALNDNLNNATTSFLDDPRTATLAAAVSQMLIAGITISNAMGGKGASFLTAVSMATIPLLFAVGNCAAGGLFERTARTIRRVFNRTSALSVPEKILTGSEPYYTSGDLVAAGPALGFVAPFFAVAAVSSLHGNITGKTPPLWRNPFVLFATASALTAGLNAAAPLVAGAFALYTIGYLSIGALQRHGGVYETVAALRPAPKTA